MMLMNPGIKAADLWTVFVGVPGVLLYMLICRVFLRIFLSNILHNLYTLVIWWKSKDASEKWLFQGAFQHPSDSGKKKKFNFLFVVCQVFQAHAELHTSYVIFLIETSAPVNSKSLCLWRDLCLQLHKLNWKCLNSVTLLFPKEWKPFSDILCGGFYEASL